MYLNLPEKAIFSKFLNVHFFSPHVKNLRKDFHSHIILPSSPTIKHSQVTIIINCQSCNNSPVPDLQPCSSSSMGEL